MKPIMRGSPRGSNNGSQIMFVLIRNWRGQFFWHDFNLEPQKKKGSPTQSWEMAQGNVLWNIKTNQNISLTSITMIIDKSFNKTLDTSRSLICLFFSICWVLVPRFVSLAPGLVSLVSGIVSLVSGIVSWVSGTVSWVSGTVSRVSVPTSLMHLDKKKVLRVGVRSMTWQCHMFNRHVRGDC